MTNWNYIRKQFPITKKYAYLDSASASPLSIEIAEEGKRFYNEILDYGDICWEKWLNEVEIIREKISKSINADKSEICFTQSTSDGMNIIGEILSCNDEIITMEEEFPTSTFPFMNKHFKIRFVKPQKSVYSLDDINNAINDKTKILITSHVQASTGFRQDLTALGNLCKKKGLVFIVDPTQSYGVYPIDVKKDNIDFLVFNSYKWIIGGYGIGVLYINKNRVNKQKIPHVGWKSVKHPELNDNKRLDLKNNASVLESGSPQFPCIFTLGKAIDYLNKIGINNIQDRINELNNYLEIQLKQINLQVVSPLDKKHRSGISIVKINNPAKIAKLLHKKNIIVSAKKSGLRVSLHVYNNKEDINKFVLELSKLVK